MAVKKYRDGSKPRQLQWHGSLAAQRQHEAAVTAFLAKTGKGKVTKKERRRRKKQAKQDRERQRKGLLPAKKTLVMPPAPVGWKTYKEYLLSDWWQARRRTKLQSIGWKCERCPSKCRLQVHHLKYSRLGREKDSDLQVLCYRCHEAEHECLIAGNAHLDAIGRS